MVEVWEVVEVFRFGRWNLAVISGVGEKVIAVRVVGRSKMELKFGDPSWSTFREVDKEIVVGTPVMILVGGNTEYAVVSKILESSVIVRKLVKDFKILRTDKEGKKWRRLVDT